MMTKLLGFGILTLVALSIGGLADLAQASHYRLPLDSMIPDPETKQLAKAGVTTTLALLQEVGTPDKRKALANKSGIPLERIETLSHQVDLLRIDGVGPSMVRLLQASGIRNSKALAQQDAAGLLQKMTAANAAAQISPVLPREGLIADWIGSAKRLPQVVSGLE